MEFEQRIKEIKEFVEEISEGFYCVETRRDSVIITLKQKDGVKYKWIFYK